MDKIDAVILAGGYGTRLAGIWDKPKCLVPIHGKPLLAYLLYQLETIKINTLVLLLGHKHTEVLNWFFTSGTYDKWKDKVVVVAEVTPAGTAAALRMATPALFGTTIVINGDTLPCYSFKSLLDKYNTTMKHPAILHAVAAYQRDTYAGAAVLSHEALVHINKTTPEDFDFYLPNMYHHQVPGFLDIGTPAGFHHAQTFHPPQDYNDSH